MEHLSVFYGTLQKNWYPMTHYFQCSMGLCKKTDIPWLIEEGLFFKETREIHFKLYQSLTKIFNFIHASWP